MSVYATSITFQMYISGAWEDFTRDVILKQHCEYGISGRAWKDRVASSGSLDLTLRNDAGCIGGVIGYYSPDNAHHKTGWGKGVNIRLVIVYDGNTYYKFFGHVSEIQVGSGQYDGPTVKVGVADWMDFTAKHATTSPEMAFNLSFTEAVTQLVGTMGVAPQNIWTDTTSTYVVMNYAFDPTRNNVFVLTELGKLAVSRGGMVYVKRDTTNGETLVIEEFLTRDNLLAGAAPAIVVPVATAAAGYCLKEDGDQVLLETGDIVVLDQTTALDFVDSMKKLDTGYGKNVANSLSLKYYPMHYDAVTSVLWEPDDPFLITAGGSLVIHGQYQDPTGGNATIVGNNFTNPAAWTNYLFNSLADWSGTDLTATLTVATNYEAGEVRFTLTNGGGSGGYVTRLQALGRAIYLLSGVTYEVEDTASIDVNGMMKLALDMKYSTVLSQATTATSDAYIWDLSGRTVAERIYLDGNKSAELLYAFLCKDVGSLIHVQETVTGVDAYYFINKVYFDLSSAGVIEYSWELCEAHFRA